jgi:hypothetical protein
MFVRQVDILVVHVERLEVRRQSRPLSERHTNPQSALAIRMMRGQVSSNGVRIQVP